MNTARVEAARAMSTYTFAAVEARKLAGDIVPMDASQAGVGSSPSASPPDRRRGRNSPFNFPLNLVAHKIAPALAAGLRRRAQLASADTDVGAAVAELEHEAGLPPGCPTSLLALPPRSATSLSRTSA